MSKTYLNWVIENTGAKWRHDSAAAAEFEFERGSDAIQERILPLKNYQPSTKQDLGELVRRASLGI